MLPTLRDLSYPERLEKLKLPNLAYRRLRSDMIEMYKVISGIYDSNILNICGSSQRIRQEMVIGDTVLNCSINSGGRA